MTIIRSWLTGLGAFALWIAALVVANIAALVVAIAITVAVLILWQIPGFEPLARIVGLVSEFAGTVISYGLGGLVVAVVVAGYALVCLGSLAVTIGLLYRRAWVNAGKSAAFAAVTWSPIVLLVLLSRE